ncbi:hypothetical protein ACE02Y_13100 [Shewanella xiamenensis]|uniref:Uncharacterized protein n=1 Tax=Shewanella xiamenensis TaxID=332186 RepID=A0AAW6R003_9GAMM|nr:hypothetical protein [Shewanella xiamenensis]MDG5901559.1 hypothetical protein [Shewanella xiamenensis]
MTEFNNEKVLHQTDSTIRELSVSESDDNNRIEQPNWLENLRAFPERIKGSQETFHLNTHRTNFFLPPERDCFNFIVGMPFKQLMKQVERLAGTAPISRSSWFELFKGGVGYRTANKVIRWFEKVYVACSSRYDDTSKRLLQKGMKDRTTSGGWLCFIGGLRASTAYQQPDFAAEFQPQIEFLLARCEANTEMSTSIFNAIKNDEINEAATSEVMALMLPFWRQYSLVPHAELEAYAKALEQHDAGALVGSEAIESLFRSYFYLYLDFYLHLFASYEVGCVLTYTLDKSELKTKKGILCRALTHYATRNLEAINSTTCFGEFLEEFRDAISKNIMALSKYDFARNIPMKAAREELPYSEESKRHYDKYRAWIKGKELPSREVLEAFFDNVADFIERDSYATEILILMCNMTMGLDKLNNSWQQQLAKTSAANSSDKLISYFYDAIGRYERYYQYHLNLQLNRATE